MVAVLRQSLLLQRNELLWFKIYYLMKQIFPRFFGKFEDPKEEGINGKQLFMKIWLHLMSSLNYLCLKQLRFK